MSFAKLKVDLVSGLVEVEGSEEFVMGIFPSLKDLIEAHKGTPSTVSDPSPDSPPVASATPVPEQEKPQSQQLKASNQADENKPKPKRATKGGPTIQPIPLDLKADSAGPSLRDFVAEKEADFQDHQELSTVFAYYLKAYKGILTVKPGHLLSCYNEVGARKPLNLPQILRNIRNRKGWLRNGSEEGSFEVTIAGENFVVHDLPKPKKATK